MFGHLFSICFSLSANIARFMELQTGMTIEQFSGIPWTQFSFEN